MLRFGRPVVPRPNIDPADAAARRRIHDVIFFGSPACEEQTAIARERLQEAFNIISGAQQPDHPETDEEAARCRVERDAWDKALIAIAEDLLAALGVEAGGGIHMKR